MTSPVTEKAIRKYVWQIPESSKVLAKRFGVGHWSFIGPGSEKKWYSAEENSPTRSLGSYRGRNAVGIRRKRTSYFPCNDSIVQGYSQEQRTWKNCQYTSLQMETQFDTIFSHYSFCQSAQWSTEQWQLYVKNLRAIKMDQGNLMF